MDEWVEAEEREQLQENKDDDEGQGRKKEENYNTDVGKIKGRDCTKMMMRSDRRKRKSRTKEDKGDGHDGQIDANHVEQRGERQGLEGNRMVRNLRQKR